MCYARVGSDPILVASVTSSSSLSSLVFSSSPSLSQSLYNGPVVHGPVSGTGQAVTTTLHQELATTYLVPSTSGQASSLSLQQLCERNAAAAALVDRADLVQVGWWADGLVLRPVGRCGAWWA